MKYKLADLMPKRYPENEPENDPDWVVWTHRKAPYNDWSRPFADEKGRWSEDIADWFIDIPGAPKKSGRGNIPMRSRRRRGGI